MSNLSDKVSSYPTFIAVDILNIALSENNLDVLDFGYSEKK